MAYRALRGDTPVLTTVAAWSTAGADPVVARVLALVAVGPPAPDGAPDAAASRAAPGDAGSRALPV